MMAPRPPWSARRQVAALARAEQTIRELTRDLAKRSETIAAQAEAVSELTARVVGLRRELGACNERNVRLAHRAEQAELELRQECEQHEQLTRIHEQRLEVQITARAMLAVALEDARTHIAGAGVAGDLAAARLARELRSVLETVGVP